MGRMANGYFDRWPGIIRVFNLGGQADGHCAVRKWEVPTMRKTIAGALVAALPTMALAQDGQSETIDIGITTFLTGPKC